MTANTYFLKMSYCFNHSLLSKKKYYPSEHLYYLGNVLVPSNNIIIPSVNPVFWDRIEDALNYWITHFKDKEYEEVEEGVFKFKD